MRIRKKLRGSAQKPRMSVFKSNRHLAVQLIDDETGKTLASVSTLEKGERSKKSKESAKQLGEKIAKLAQEKEIREVSFDRGPFRYHGVLAELAEAARAGGLKF